MKKRINPTRSYIPWNAKPALDTRLWQAVKQHKAAYGTQKFWSVVNKTFTSTAVSAKLLDNGVKPSNASIRARALLLAAERGRPFPDFIIRTEPAAATKRTTKRQAKSVSTKRLESAKGPPKRNQRLTTRTTARPAKLNTRDLVVIDVVQERLKRIEQLLTPPAPVGPTPDQRFAINVPVDGVPVIWIVQSVDDSTQEVTLYGGVNTLWTMPIQRLMQEFTCVDAAPTLTPRLMLMRGTACAGE